MTNKYVSGIGSVPLTTSEEVAFSAKESAYYAGEPQRAKDAKQARITADFQAAVAALKNGYTDEEMATWYRQELEVRNFRANTDAGNTPFLDAMVAAKGSNRSAVAANIESLSAEYSAAVGAALGAKKARQEALEAIDLTSPDAVAQIDAI